MSKRPGDGGNQHKNFKRSRLHNARIIRAEVNDTSFKDGVLDVPSFVNSRKYEIDQLEKAQLNAKYASSTRVFQSLPRGLRRRAASHNVKRIPKRMRNKAIREMLLSSVSAENANELKPKKKRLSGRELYKLKLSKNLLKLTSKLNMLKILPSDQLLNKNLNVRSMIRILKKQIKEHQQQRKLSSDKETTDIDGDFKIATISQKPKINNNYGSYDNTGINELAKPSFTKIKYSRRQKYHQWISTHIWHAKRFHLIKRWGWNIPYKPTQKCFKLTHRTFKNTGSLVFDTSYEGTIVIDIDDSHWKNVRNVLQDIIQKRFNESLLNGTKFFTGDLYASFNNNDLEIISTGLMYCNKYENRYKVLFQVHPANFEEFWQYLHLKIKVNANVSIQDCRYSLGSIDLIGPKSIDALVSVLHPVDRTLNKQWGRLNKISNIESLGKQSVVSLMINDPRFYKRPLRRRLIVSEDEVLEQIMDLSCGKYANAEHNNQLLTSAGRAESYSNQQTIKQINQRRRKLDNIAQVKIDVKDDDSKIPILLLIDAKTKKYKLLAPWFWISPIWYQLVRIPRVVPAGILQMNQILFELSKPFYPNDYPFTKDGYIENQLIGKEALEKWSKKPKSKRLNYQNVLVCASDYKKYGIKGELGDWFNCDWRFLQLLILLKKIYYKNLERGRTEADNTVSKNLIGKMTIWDDKTFLRKVFKHKDIYDFIKDIKVVDEEKNARGEKLVNPIKVCHNSVESVAAFNRVINTYLKLNEENINNEQVARLLDNRLPVSKVTVKLVNGGKIKSNARLYSFTDTQKAIFDTETHDKLTRFITESPSFENLVGFVTTGSFNLEQGYYTGLGCIVSEVTDSKKHGYCIVRNPGSKTVRVAQYCLYRNVY